MKARAASVALIVLLSLSGESRAALRVEAGDPGALKAVAAVTGDSGFFALKAFRGRLYAGTYSRTGRQEIRSGASPLTRTLRPARDAGGIIIPLPAGESVYEFEEFRGRLYANTENRGKIFRLRPDGKWRQVGRIGGNGYSLAVYDGYLYAGNQYGHVYRTSTGSFEGLEPFAVFENDIREMTVFNDKLIVMGFDFGEERGIIRAFDGRSWRRFDFESLDNQRIIKSRVWDGYVWFSTSPYFGGARVTPAGVWRWDGAERPEGLVNVFNDRDRAIGSDLFEFQGRLYFLAIEKWHGEVGIGAALHRREAGGEWIRNYAVFPRQPEAWTMEEFEGNLFVSTSYCDRGGGRVYRVFTEEVCDGFDNDGDAAVDEENVCPEAIPSP